jgi:hypothetical protein
LATLPASAGTPRVSFAYPAAGQRGAETEVTFRGTKLADARDILFDAPGFEAVSIKAEDTQFKALVRVPADATLGEHRCRVITRSGVADLRVFFVTPFPLLEETIKPKPTATAPQVVPLNTTVYGKTPVDDEDHYAVDLKKGERLSIEVAGLQLHTQNPYDPEITITKPDGSHLATVGNTVFGRGAPIFSGLAPEEGRYRISLRDATRSGAGECHYLMHIGTFARPVTALPLGGPAGAPSHFALLGDPNGTIQLTANPGQKNHSFGSLLVPGEPPAPTPLAVRVSDLPNVLEKGQVATPVESAGPATALPAAFNGLIEKADEKDYFRFSAKKGQACDFRVYARTLRSPLDSVIEIYNDKGARLATNDDSAAPDSYLRWSAPADGEFILAIKDQQNRGGALFTYRVEASHVVPKVKISLPEMTLNQSQDRRAIVIPQGNRYASQVRVKREDWTGALELLTPDLPPDVVASAGNIEKAFDTVPMVFEASTAAPTDQRLIEIGARSLEAPEAPTPMVLIEHKVDVSENANRRAFYSVLESRLPIVVTDPIPVKIDVEVSKASIVRSGQLPLKVKVSRTGDFRGPIDLVLLHTPPGLGTAGGVKIPAGASEGILPITATADAAMKPWKLCVVGNADFGKGVVWFSTGMFELEVGDAPFAGTLVRTSLPQNGTGQMKLKIEPKAGFEGKAKVELLGLPLGVTAKPVEITQEDTLATFELTAATTATIGLNKQVVVQCTFFKDGSPVVSTCARGGILRVDKPDAPPAPVVAAVAPTAPPSGSTPAEKAATPAAASPAPVATPTLPPAALKSSAPATAPVETPTPAPKS